MSACSPSTTRPFAPDLARRVEGVFLRLLPRRHGGSWRLVDTAEMEAAA